jgi:hypothetical protein
MDSRLYVITVTGYRKTLPDDVRAKIEGMGIYMPINTPRRIILGYFNPCMGEAEQSFKKGLTVHQCRMCLNESYENSKPTENIRQSLDIGQGWTWLSDPFFIDGTVIIMNNDFLGDLIKSPNIVSGSLFEFIPSTHQFRLIA